MDPHSLQEPESGHEGNGVSTLWEGFLCGFLLFFLVFLLLLPAFSCGRCSDLVLVLTKKSSSLVVTDYWNISPCLADSVSVPSPTSQPRRKIPLLQSHPPTEPGATREVSVGREKMGGPVGDHCLLGNCVLEILSLLLAQRGSSRAYSQQRSQRRGGGGLMETSQLFPDEGGPTGSTKPSSAFGGSQHVSTATRFPLPPLPASTTSCCDLLFVLVLPTHLSHPHSASQNPLILTYTNTHTHSPFHTITNIQTTIACIDTVYMHQLRTHTHSIPASVLAYIQHTHACTLSFRHTCKLTSYHSIH